MLMMRMRMAMLFMIMRMFFIADDENAARPSTVSEGFNRGDPGLEEGEPESHLGVDCC